MDANEREGESDPLAVSVRVYSCPFAVELLLPSCPPYTRVPPRTLGSLRSGRCDVHSVQGGGRGDEESVSFRTTKR
jgi:hypothetical protein